MSKSKGLEFDKTQPAFLQRLRGQISGQTGDPDRSIDTANRPKIPKRLEAGEDDGPTYVLEDGTTLTKDEFAAMEKGEEDPPAESLSHEAAASTNQSTGPHNQKATSTTTAKKRKAVKVIGGNDSDDDNNGTNTSTTKALKTDKPLEDAPQTTMKKAPKKKKAKVKLDFGEDENT